MRDKSVKFEIIRDVFEELESVLFSIIANVDSRYRIEAMNMYFRILDEMKQNIKCDLESMNEKKRD